MASANLTSSVDALPDDILEADTKEIQDLLMEIDKYRKINVQNKQLLKCVNQVVFTDKAIPPLNDKVNDILKRDYYFKHFNTGVSFLDLDESERMDMSTTEKIQLRLEVCKKIKSKYCMSQLKTSRKLGTYPKNMLKLKQDDVAYSKLGTLGCLSKLVVEHQSELLNLKADLHEQVAGYKEVMGNTMKILQKTAEWKHNEDYDNISTEIEKLDYRLRFLELSVKSNLVNETPNFIAAVKTNLSHMEEDIKHNKSKLEDLTCMEAAYSNVLNSKEYVSMLQKYQDLRKQIEYMKWACEKFNN